MRPRSYRRAERLDSVFVSATTKSGKGRPMKIGTLFELGVLGAISLNNRDFLRGSFTVGEKIFPAETRLEFRLAQPLHL